MPRTKLLIVEGMDGAGKGTAISLLQRALQERGEDVVVFREPGVDGFGKKMRDIVTSEARPVSPEARALLYIASRVEMYNLFVKPSIKAGKTVILDRCWMSTFAYSPKDHWDWLFNLHEGVEIFDLNSVTFYLDIDYLTHEKRMTTRRKKDVVEEELVTNFDEYRKKYHRVIRELCPEVNNKVFVLNGKQPLENVFLDIMDCYDEVFA